MPVPELPPNEKWLQKVACARRDFRQRDVTAVGQLAEIGICIAPYMEVEMNEREIWQADFDWHRMEEEAAAAEMAAEQGWSQHFAFPGDFGPEDYGDVVERQMMLIDPQMNPARG